MKCRMTKKTMKRFGMAALILWVFVVIGCASGVEKKSGVPPINRFQGQQQDASILKHITQVELIEQPDSIGLHLEGDQMLNFYPVKRPFPPAVILFFSDTALTAEKTAFTPDGNIIESIDVSVLDGKKNATKVEILFKENISPDDATPDISRKGNNIDILFSRGVRPTSYGRMSDTRGLDEGDAEIIQPVTEIDHTATRIESVYASREDDSLKVFVGADGAIANYKAFTIESPPGIVFDFFNIKSPYKNEKQVAVKTKWVKRIRYFAYPDRLRLVLDTEKVYLSKFSAYPVDNGLMIHVGKGEILSPAVRYAASKKVSPESSERTAGIGPANRLKSVYATQLDDSTMVTIRGDDSIKNYKARVAENPPRIVFDIYNIQNPFEKESTFPVDTQWIRQISHETHPDRFQLSIETKEQYLSSFSAHTDQNGLVIYVGKGEGLSQSGGIKSVIKPAPAVEKNEKRAVSRKDYSGKPAWVNRIEFIPEEAGKATLIVGTTRSIEYDLRQTGEKKMELELFNTRIPGYRQQPLVTSRFDSAVDQIIPAKNPSDSRACVFSINLREAVPNFIEQSDNLIALHFEASSIAPKIAEPSSGTDISDSNLASASSTALETTSYARPSNIPGNITDAGITKSDVTFEPDMTFSQNRAAASAGKPSPIPESFDSIPDTGMAGSDGIEEPSDLSGGMSAKTYSGEKIALDFFETDIKNVFRILREVSGKNFAVDNDVVGKVTLTLEHPVPWDQVLDLVLKMNQLGKTLEGDIIRVATLETLKKEETERQEITAAKLAMRKEEIALEELDTVYIAINYSDAESEIKPHLEQIKTPDRGTLSVDKRTNMIIMTDTKDKIKQAREIVEKLDRVTPQVIIEARIVEASSKFNREIGTQWSADIGIKNDNEAKAGIGPQRGYDMLGGTHATSMAVNLPMSSAAAGTIGFNFARLAGSPLLLDAKLMAMESRKEGNVISSPRVLTLDNKSATISQGFEYPYQQVDDGKISISFKKVDLKLQVTPHITPDNRISMKVEIDKNDVYEQTSDGPALSTNKASTELLVNDGDTFVIGGIIKENMTRTNSGVPGLSRIPILGWLFKSKIKELKKDELLIFITPRIVQLEQRQSQY
ncbi:type IV pilus secretin PilQ [Desulfobacterales bacterium HSG16]|nr:type IV pilus secretin PilQ [Desulfobacterales bacterium HSG16]